MGLEHFDLEGRRNFLEEKDIISEADFEKTMEFCNLAWGSTSGNSVA
jgi:hypothetical protein